MALAAGGLADADLLPPFLRSLRTIVDTETDAVVWRADGAHFTILDPPAFAANVLPRHFNHAKFKSFVRQLNNFSFSKVAGPANALGPCTFAHDYFLRDAPELIHRIKRKPQKRRRGQLTRAARIAATGNPPATSDAARVTDLRVEVESLKRTRDEYEHAIDSMAMRQADMERRVADLDATAEALRDQVDAARNQHAALAAAIDNLRAVLPPGFTAAMAPQASVPVAPAPMDLAAPQQPIATRLHNETLDLIFGTIVSPTLSTDSDGPFPPVSLRPGLSATPPLPVDDRHDYTRPLKRARPLAPIDAPKDHHAHDPFWTHAGALLTPTWASRT